MSCCNATRELSASSQVEPDGVLKAGVSILFMHLQRSVLILCEGLRSVQSCPPQVTRVQLSGELLMTLQVPEASPLRQVVKVRVTRESWMRLRAPEAWPLPQVARIQGRPLARRRAWHQTQAPATVMRSQPVPHSKGYCKRQPAGHPSQTHLPFQSAHKVRRLGGRPVANSGGNRRSLAHPALSDAQRPGRA